MGCAKGWSWCLMFAGLLLSATAAVLHGADSDAGGQRAEPGPLTSLTIGPQNPSGPLAIRGSYARQQLFVCGTFGDGQQRDLTRDVTYEVNPQEIISIDATGLITPLRDGEAHILAVSAGEQLAAELTVCVEGMSNPRPINFKNQIVPIFTKLGCSGGGCHGKASGQNGFRLSLLGFYPEEDYEFLVKESRGRRLFPAAPGESLILQKALGHMHGGGQRMQPGSYEYQLICQWIEQSMPYGSSDDPTLVAIRCLPESRIMDRGAQQQITTMAFYSDGSTEDVTGMAMYEANDAEMAEVSGSGVVTTGQLFGEVTVMARYQGQVSTFRATVPLGADTSRMPTARNLIDEAVFAKLTELGIPASDLCDDSTFLRRVTIDITGTLPTAEQVTAFLQDQDPGKRDRLIDQLLDSTAYADYFANKWNMVLRNKKRNSDELQGSLMFYRWIWSSLYENRPYDQFVREILTAAGDLSSNPAVTWYREVDEATEQVEDVAQLFMGLRIQCARCHHHPYEKWSQDDYYGLAAYFSRLGKKNIADAPRPARDRKVFHQDGAAGAHNPRNGMLLRPGGLDMTMVEIPQDRDPRVFLANWLVDPANPFFARAAVNRYWKHFFGRGIVEPEDDMRATNPPSNPELLDALAAHFTASGFDLKDLVRTICQSQTYQLSAVPNAYNATDKQSFSRHYPQRLKAEVLYDAFHQVTRTTATFPGWPAGTRAVQVVDVDVSPYFLTVFGQPQATTACECERQQNANLAQSLHLLNSSEVQEKVAAAGGRAALWAADTQRPSDDRIRELYRWTYARQPDAEELQIALTHLAHHEATPQIAWEDLLWALINTREFLFNN